LSQTLYFHRGSGVRTNLSPFLKSSASGRHSDEMREQMKRKPYSVPVSVDQAYEDLDAKPPGNKDGDLFRRMARISWQYERRLFASARDTGYASALHRRVAVQNDISAAIDALLKHRPKTVKGLQQQAAACAMDHDARWKDHPRLAAFVSSAMEFGPPEAA
jgi:hypothetical protein